MSDRVENLIKELYFKYVNEFGLIPATPATVGDNDIVYTAQFILWCNLLGFKWRKEDVKKILEKFYAANESFIRQRPDKSSYVDTASHDNITSILSLSYIYDLDYHKTYEVFNGKTPHPRDWLFYLALKYPKFQFLFKPIVGLCMLDSCITEFEWNPMRFFQKQNTVKDDHYIESRYKTYNDATSFTTVRMRYLATSTKLLCFIRFQTLNFGIFERLCEKILKKRFGGRFWYEIAFIYFKRNSHPCVELPHEYYMQQSGSSGALVQ